MGIVFRGRDRELDRDVAIKVTAWSTEADADRLRAEARDARRLEHPGIVPVHDVGQLPDGRVFTVMMLVRGERLDALRRRRLPLPDRLRLFDRICDTVSFAHARGVIHRDLKPANIMVGRFGQVLVLDWGLARAGVGPAAASGGGQPSGAPKATWRRSRARRHVDARSDVYALGAILDGLAGRFRIAIPATLSIRRSIGPGSLIPRRAIRTSASLAADVRRFVDGAAVTAHRETAAGAHAPRGAGLSHADRAACWPTWRCAACCSSGAR